MKLLQTCYLQVSVIYKTDVKKKLDNDLCGFNNAIAEQLHPLFTIDWLVALNHTPYLQLGKNSLLLPVLCHSVHFKFNVGTLWH